VAWSTRQLAELTGTTVNTIRHYHRVGLLDEPERRCNGYKQYGVQDLVRLLRIRRLVELGVPLARIGEAGADGVLSREALLEVDAGLAADIDRLVQARSAIAAVLRDGAPADTPAGFQSVAARLSGSDSSLIHIYQQLYDEQAMTDLRHMVEADTDPISEDIDTLPPDADEATRQNLAEKLAPILAQHLADYAWLSDPAAHLSKSDHVTQQTFLDAVVELYNTAQLDVLGRASILAQEHLRVPRTTTSEATGRHLPRKPRRAQPRRPESPDESSANRPTSMPVGFITGTSAGERRTSWRAMQSHQTPAA
jgi:DNA-binding transcriptional MerR regulator